MMAAPFLLRRQARFASVFEAGHFLGDLHRQGIGAAKPIGTLFQGRRFNFVHREYVVESTQKPSSLRVFPNSCHKMQ